MKKIIHIYTQYYYPVANAASNRVEKYVKALKDDYDIKVITWIPNYPIWIKSSEYKWKIFKKEVWVLWEKIIRVYEFATKNEWLLGRIINFLSFMFSSFLYWLFTKKPDKIIVTSPPLFTAISVLLLHKIKRIPYVLEIRDLWPDSVVALWFIKNSLIYKLFSWIEKSLYKNAESIIWVTKWICRTIENKWFNLDKINLQYNISEEVKLSDLENPYSEFFDKIKWRKISLFAWNMNEAYDFDISSEYINNHNDIFFVFIWDWSQKVNFINNLLWLDNVIFFDRKSKNEIDLFLYYSDIVFVPLKNEKFYKWTFPVKGIEWIVNNKEIIFFGPEDWEFNNFLIDLKNKKVNKYILEFEYFKKNIIWLLK